MTTPMRRRREAGSLTRALHVELAAVADVMPGWELEVCQSSTGFYVAARFLKGSDDAELMAARAEPRVFGHSPSLALLKHWLRAFCTGVQVGRWINRTR